MKPAWVFAVTGWVLAAGMLGTPVDAAAQSPTAGDDTVVQAREALRKGDSRRLATLRDKVQDSGHPLAGWVAYWDLLSRLQGVQAAEADAFFSRWAGTYVEDRFRNDWLLELGRRRDWERFALHWPRFQMNDDREVTCYGLLTRHLAGQDVATAARAALAAQRDADDGCALLATTLHEARRLKDVDLWDRARLSLEAGKPKGARSMTRALGAREDQLAAEALDQPQRFLARPTGLHTQARMALAALAVMRLAATDWPAAVAALRQPYLDSLPPTWGAVAWAHVARLGAQRQDPSALTLYAQAAALQARAQPALAWSDETLAWQVRAALRADAPAAERARVVLAAIEAMSASEQQDPAWVFWRARALQWRADAPGRTASERQADRQAATAAMQGLGSPLSFYGKLALEDQGRSLALPPSPAALTPTERAQAQTHAGLGRALHLMRLGLRGEGVREWNFSLRGMGDRELLAAAQRACEQQVWDRCINTSERTRGEVDLQQRFPTPFREQVVRVASELALDPAYVYGLIRQESRFILDARSHVGASGLMQLMPATAAWTARKVGIAWKPDMVTDLDINLRLGSTYLKLVLDDFGGSSAMAAAAYNAGPGRPRRWREGPVMDAAAWAECIPLAETRDYVKRVLSNATVYGAMLRPDARVSLRTRLGATIGPRDAAAPEPNRSLP